MGNIDIHMPLNQNPGCSADTLFLATCWFGQPGEGDGVSGCDTSHRGGPPGFVQVSEAGTLQFADYVGNFTFTTLGQCACHALPFSCISPCHVLNWKGTCA